MKIILAPMEGVIDFAMRDILTTGGSYDHCVTEFIRITDTLLPKSTYHRYCPELFNEGKTKSGTPVYVQLLGHKSDWVAENAVRASELGALGIDLNFGCPAKTVNNHRGGSILLDEPETVYQIVKAVRDSVPGAIPVSVKMRLGYNDKSRALENAFAIENAGANQLAIHARTKQEGYKPPAHWEWIAKIGKNLKISLVANGEIWSKQDAYACMKQSCCENIMIGRGGLSLPNLGDVIRNNEQPLLWPQVCALIIKYSEYDRGDGNKNFTPNRIKQWFSYLKKEFKEAEPTFQLIKKNRDVKSIIQIIQENNS
jgi:tRNA-dihydrouridine synthase C